ncbi:MAG: hypothetical protein ACI8S6_002512 [Myxococcota bacterium]|jgi:hypothetical protein
MMILMWACSGEEAIAVVVDSKAEPTAPRMVSPPPGETVEVDTLPLFVRLPGILQDATAAVTLDGVDITDPEGFIGRRWKAQGKGAEYLATLDLSDVAAGEHTLGLTFTLPDGTAQSIEGTFRWAPPLCALDVSVTDELGAPLDARVLMQRSGRPVLWRWPAGKEVDPMGRDTKLSAFFVSGRRTVHLPARSVTLIASRGIRYDVATVELPLTEALCKQGPQAVSLVLPEAVPTPGRITADFHVHTGHSGDSYTPDRLRRQSLEAADLDLIVFSDHNHIWDPAPMIAELPENVRGWPSIEVRVGQYNSNLGHVNIYPLDPTAPLPEYSSRDLTALYDGWRDHQEEHPFDGVTRPLVQLNHPRGIQIRPGDNPAWRAHAVFSQGGFDRTVPVGEGTSAWMTRPNAKTGTTILDFDVLEVLNRFSWMQYLEVRQDWFLLLNLGRTPTGVGNSDSHALAVELVGYPVSLVSTAGGSSTAALVESVGRGAVTVSSGPIVDLTVESGEDRLRVGDRGTGRDHEAVVTVQAAPWVPVTEARLIINGVVVQRQALTSPLPAEGVTLRWPVVLESDSWIIAEAGWPPEDAEQPGTEALGMYATVAPGYVPIGFTNPIWLDAEGDGQWRGMTPQDAAGRSGEMHGTLRLRLGEALIGPR